MPLPLFKEELDCDKPLLLALLPTELVVEGDDREEVEEEGDPPEGVALLVALPLLLVVLETDVGPGFVLDELDVLPLLPLDELGEPREEE